MRTSMPSWAAIIAIKCFDNHYRSFKLFKWILAHSSLQYTFISGMLVGFLAWTACFWHNIFIRLRWGSGHSRTLVFVWTIHHMTCTFWIIFCMTCFLLTFSSWTDALIFSFKISWCNSEFGVPSMMVNHPSQEIPLIRSCYIFPHTCITKLRLW